MNRLILIGNGFDLAHGYKTGYSDFMLDYLKNGFIKNINAGITNIGYKQFSLDNYLVVNIKDYYKFNEAEINICISINDLKEKFSAEVRHRNYNEDLLSKIVNSFQKRDWFDIESLYYLELKKQLKRYNRDEEEGSDTSKTIENLKKINNQLDFIKNKLEQYLSYHIQSKPKNKLPILQDIFYDGLSFMPMQLDSILVLNFNYTKTPNFYVKSNEMINIHGELNNNKNPIIFGYGDELDKNYNDIEDLNQNEFFKHIKSFDYFKTSNYNNLLRFIEAGDFEIFTMGHSCGLSDRTMLSTIFEHPNCKLIKIFYHKNYDSYRKITYEISRHFKDKPAMRKKIAPFSQCIPMPQHDDIQS